MHFCNRENNLDKITKTKIKNTLKPSYSYIPNMATMTKNYNNSCLQLILTGATTVSINLAVL